MYRRRRRRSRWWWKQLNRVRLYVVIYYCTQFCRTWDKHHREAPLYAHTHIRLTLRCKVNMIFTLTAFSLFFMVIMLGNLMYALVLLSVLRIFPKCVRVFPIEIKVSIVPAFGISDVRFHFNRSIFAASQVSSFEWRHFVVGIGFQADLDEDIFNERRFQLWFCCQTVSFSEKIPLNWPHYFYPFFVFAY